MNQNDIQVINLDKTYKKQAINLLKQYQETSLFLLGNLTDFGPTMGESVYSGNFKCLIKNDQVVAVFVLSKIGNLLLQTDRKQDYSDIILQACLTEEIPIKGVIGEYSLAKTFWETLQQKFETLQTNTDTKDILYQLDLNQVDIPTTNDPAVRFLEKSDFNEFDALHCAFMQEMNLDQGQTRETRYQNFINAVSKQRWWGLFQNEQLIAKGAYGVHFEKMAQIGGIYTIPNMRHKGFSRRLIKQMMKDSLNIHNVEKLILYTQEDNMPARNLYESLNFKPIGKFCLILGEIK